MNTPKNLTIKLEREGQIVADLHQQLLELKNSHRQIEAALNDLSIVADELVSNVLKYSQTEASAPVFELKMQIMQQRLFCQLKDNGLFFDPFAADEPDLDVPVVERDIGGLGLLLVHNLTEDGRYYSQDNMNFTEFYIAIESNAD